MGMQDVQHLHGSNTQWQAVISIGTKDRTCLDSPFNPAAAAAAAAVVHANMCVSCPCCQHEENPFTLLWPEVLCLL